MELTLVLSSNLVNLVELENPNYEIFFQRIVTLVYKNNNGEENYITV